MLTIKLEKDGITPDVRRLLRETRADGALGRVLGRAAANELRRHFRSRTGEANQLGGKRTYFWSRVAESVGAPRASGGTIAIGVIHPAIAQKVHGGTITPKKAKNLAIPLTAEAYGKSPRIITGLHYARTKSGTQLLGLTRSGVFRALYVLKKSVTQDADPKALPAASAMSAALARAARQWRASGRA